MIVHRQQPAGEALRHGVMLAARDRLTDDPEQRLCVAQKQALQRTAKSKLFPQVSRFHSHGGASNLHDSLVGRHETAEKNIDAHHSFVADDADLDGAPVFDSVNHGHYGRFRKVNVVDALLSFIDNFAAFEDYLLEFAMNVLVFRVEERMKDVVLDWGGSP